MNKLKKGGRDFNGSMVINILYGFHDKTEFKKMDERI